MIRRLILAMMAALALSAPATAADGEAAALERLHQKIAANEIAGVHSVIVMRGSRTLAEWYFPGADEQRGRLGRPTVAFDATTLHDVRSVTKSVVAILVGIAVDDGRIKSLDTPVLDYFPEYADLRGPERNAITLRHLLTMGSGLHWDEDTYSYIDPRNSETAMDLSKDPLRYVLSQASDWPAGTRFRYSGGDVALAAAILARATKQPVDAYAQARLFAPLGITSWAWHKDAQGTPYAASGLRLTPREMANLGRLLLQKGRWNGRQVVSAKWVAAMLGAQRAVEPDPKCGRGYGYFWWRFAGCQLDPPLPWVAAVGNGGQRIVLVPDQDLLLVMTAGHYNSPKQGPTTTAVITGVLSAVRAR